MPYLCLEMLSKQFKTHIYSNAFFESTDFVAVAVSGGSDSVCLAYLMNSLARPFAIVHCDFGLRGHESDEDAEFVEELAQSLEYCTSFFSEKFKTKEFAKAEKIGIQEAARELRYSYFLELHQQGKFDWLCTAHHLNDNVETFLHNLSRSSGLRGLRGIPETRDYLIRPLLPFSKDQLVEYLTNHNYLFREDASNHSSKYTRNKIRNELIPNIEKALPQFQPSVSKSLKILTDEHQLLESLLQLWFEQNADYEHNTKTLKIAKSSLLSFPQTKPLLYYLLYDYNFTPDQTLQAFQLLRSPSAHELYSETHQLIIDRKYISIQKKINTLPNEIVINQAGIFGYGKYEVIVEPTSETILSKNHEFEIVSLNTVRFPFTLRVWQERDFIQPLGMKGHKLLSDFFTDEKVSHALKKNLPLLAQGHEILWIPGFRISERIKIKEASSLFKLSFRTIT